MEAKYNDGMKFETQKASLQVPSTVQGHRNPEISPISGKSMTGANYN
mgnify:CR=1 FL=1